MGSISSFDFLRIEGPQIPLLASDIQIIDRPGTDGVAFRANALKAEELVLRTIEGLSSLETANGRPDDYAALKGETVIIEDDQGRSVNDVLIVEVRVTGPPQKMINPVPAGNDYLVRAAWVVKPTSAGG